MKHFFHLWRRIVFSPRTFFLEAAEENWQQQPLSFLLFCSWLLALGATLMIYINKYWPIGVTLVERINAWQRVLVIPVIAGIVFTFFVITFVIIGGVFVLLFYFLFFGLAFWFQAGLSFLKVRVAWQKLLPLLFYSSAVLLFGLLIFLWAILGQGFGWGLPFLRLGYNLVYYFSCLYFAACWTLILQREGKLPRFWALLVALSAVLLLVLFQVVFDLKLFDKAAKLMI